MPKNILPFQFICISVFLFLYSLSSCSFSAKTTERYFNKAKTQSYEMIAVPGVPFSETGWESTMKARIYWAKYLYEKGIAKNVMFSGAAVSTPYYEGGIMALYAIAIGIPKEHVFSETKAEHSTENLFYSYLKSKKLGFNHIALATDPYQAKQLRRFAKQKISKDVGIIPIVFDTLRTIQPFMINPVIDYQQAYKKDFVALKSRESFWKRLRGTMGKHIDPNAY